MNDIAFETPDGILARRKEGGGLSRIRGAGSGFWVSEYEHPNYGWGQITDAIGKLALASPFLLPRRKIKPAFHLYINQKIIHLDPCDFFAAITQQYDGEALVVPVEAPPQSTLANSSEFQPSSHLTRFIIDNAITDHESGAGAFLDKNKAENVAANQIKEAVGGLFHSMAETLLESESPTSFVLGRAGKFEELIAKALLYRVSVDFYQSLHFLAELYREVRQAATNGQLSGPFWKVVSNTDGTLVLETAPHKKDNEVVHEKVKVRSVKFGARPPLSP